MLTKDETESNILCLVLFSKKYFHTSVINSFQVINFYVINTFGDTHYLNVALRFRNARHILCQKTHIICFIIINQGFRKLLILVKVTFFHSVHPINLIRTVIFHIILQTTLQFSTL